MEKIKENAYNEWFTMIEQSWTWAKLTDEERGKFRESMDSWCNYRGLLRGTWKQRWEILNQMYHIYLEGLGYEHGKFRGN